jgi:hypothetical protein
MAAGGSPYVVEWQLPNDEDQRARPLYWPGDAIGMASRDHLERLADFSGALADADAAAVVACCPTGIAIEAASLNAPRLHPGAIIPVHPSLGYGGNGAIGLLLSGRQRWCRSSPPPGFGVAALVRAPSLALSGQLLLLANRERSLSELNLRLVASYLASMRPAPTAANIRPITAGTRSGGQARAALVLHA